MQKLYETESVPLFIGSQIKHVEETLEVAASQDIPVRCPVKLDADGRVVVATDDAPAIGITDAPVKTAAGVTGKVCVIRAGVLNRDAINWPAAFNTNALKEAAFRGADAPTNIFVKSFI